jgi:hypothetical protein
MMQNQHVWLKMTITRKAIGIFIAVIVVISVGLTTVALGVPETEEKAPPCTSNLTGFVDPVWNALFQYDVETPTGDNLCLGVEFDGTFFWITGGGNGTNKTAQIRQKWQLHYLV